MQDHFLTTLLKELKDNKINFKTKLKTSISAPQERRKYNRLSKKFNTTGDARIPINALKKKTVSFRKLPFIRIANVKKSKTYFRNLNMPTREKSTKLLMKSSTLLLN
mgnify:CR=1 FL=1